jgi:hypothetical protein
MFQHTGLLTLIETAGLEQRQTISEGLTALVGVVPGLLSAEVRTDAGLQDGNADLMFTMTFTDRAAWQAYGSHPAHVEVKRTAIGPVLRSKVFLQSESEVD